MLNACMVVSQRKCLKSFQPPVTGLQMFHDQTMFDYSDISHLVIRNGNSFKLHNIYLETTVSMHCWSLSAHFNVRELISKLCVTEEECERKGERLRAREREREI